MRGDGGRRSWILRVTLPAILLLALSGTARTATDAATAPPPDRAPSPEELDRRAQRWRDARRRGAYLILGSLTVSTLIIALVRRSRPRGRPSQPPGP